MLCITNSESEQDLCGGIWRYSAHFSANLALGIDGKYSIFLDKSLEVHSIAIETDLNPREFRK
jgi:hypothetical protein